MAVFEPEIEGEFTTEYSSDDREEDVDEPAEPLVIAYRLQERFLLRAADAKQNALPEYDIIDQTGAVAYRAAAKAQSSTVSLMVLKDTSGAKQCVLIRKRSSALRMVHSR